MAKGKSDVADAKADAISAETGAPPQQTGTAPAVNAADSAPAPAAPTQPPVTPPGAIAPIQAADLIERQKVAQDALARQLDNKPPAEKHNFRVVCNVNGEQRANTFAARDDNEAWAFFCDSLKLPEGRRARRIARPQITDLGPAE